MEKNNKIIKKRFLRLIIPTWIFLIIFFIISSCFHLCDLNLNIIVSSFLLNDGIGYVWIIRIYFLLAIILCVYKKIRKPNNFKYILLFTIVLYVVYEFLCYYGVFNNSILMYFFAYIIPCITIVVITDWIKKSNNKSVTIFSIISLIVFVIAFFIIYKSTGEIKNTNYYKYPFRLYYLSYALFISSVLICIYRFDKITNVCYNSYVRFVSSHSLYFYLWHILFIYIFKDLSILWLFKYLLIICLTSIIVFIQNIIINYMERKKINSNIINLFRG